MERFIYSSHSVCWKGRELWKTSLRTKELAGTLSLACPLAYIQGYPWERAQFQYSPPRLLTVCLTPKFSCRLTPSNTPSRGVHPNWHHRCGLVQAAVTGASTTPKWLGPQGEGKDNHTHQFNYCPSSGLGVVKWSDYGPHPPAKASPGTTQGKTCSWVLLHLWQTRDVTQLKPKAAQTGQTKQAPDPAHRRQREPLQMTEARPQQCGISNTHRRHP